MKSSQKPLRLNPNNNLFPNSSKRQRLNIESLSFILEDIKLLQSHPSSRRIVFQVLNIWRRYTSEKINKRMATRKDNGILISTLPCAINSPKISIMARPIRRLIAHCFCANIPHTLIIKRIVTTAPDIINRSGGTATFDRIPLISRMKAMVTNEC